MGWWASCVGECAGRTVEGDDDTISRRRRLGLTEQQTYPGSSDFDRDYRVPTVDWPRRVSPSAFLSSVWCPVPSAPVDRLQDLPRTGTASTG